ncbi:MAG: hypothetical protein PF447_13650 [Spirochaetaceae bacterium]|jgi:hypothetical protein|nr:hypothetical protein [Spirochaetaceae bacterium]
MKAEEIIVEIYRQKQEHQQEGNLPSKVIINMEQYREIQRYHVRLGKLKGSLPDYITADSLFGLEILIDNQEQTVVC